MQKTNPLLEQIIKPFINKFGFDREMGQVMEETMERMVVTEILMKLEKELPEEEQIKIKERLEQVESDKGKLEILGEVFKDNEKVQEIVKNYMDNELKTFIMKFLEKK